MSSYEMLILQKFSVNGIWSNLHPYCIWDWLHKWFYVKNSYAYIKATQSVAMDNKLWREKLKANIYV